jgi:hypothetical protein
LLSRTALPASSKASVALLLVVTVTGGITSEFEVFEDGGEVN